MITSEYKAPERLTINVESIDSLRLLSCNNKILVRPVYDTANYKTKSGIIMVGDIEFEKADNSNRVGEVVKVPDGLFFSRKSNRSMDWDTDLEVAVGDLVWYDITEAWNAPIVIHNKTHYYLVRYDSCIVAKRGDKVIMLNGFNLCEPVYETYQSAIEDPNKKRLNNFEAIVRYTGVPVRGYFNKGWTSEKVSVGDRVRLRKLKNADTPAIIFLEDEKFKMFDGNMYRIVHGRDIECVMP